MTALTKDAILAAAQTPPARELVTVEGFGSVWVRGLTASEKNDLDAEQMRFETIKGQVVPRLVNERMTAKWLVRGIITEDGAPMFGLGDITALGKLPAKVTTPIEDAIKRLSGADRGVTIEALKGNSEGERAD